MYQGEYKNDERFGKGIMVWSECRRYRGSWAYGMRHGYGESIELELKDFEDRESTVIRLRIEGGIWNQDKVMKHLFK